MQGVKSSFVLRDSLFNANSHLDENNFYNEQNGEPAQLSKMLTYLLGSNSNYPLTTMTYGNVFSQSATKTVDNIEYWFPVMGRDYKATQVAETVTTTNLGYGRSIFKLAFKDNRLLNGYIISSPQGLHAKVVEPPVADGKNWIYKLQLTGVSAKASVPLSEIKAGAKWVNLFHATSVERSRGGATTSVRPAKVKNQISILRKSISWGGTQNVDENKVMDFTIKTATGETNLWMEYWMYQFEKQWIQEQELLYWYGKYNRGKDGAITLMDTLNNEPIPIGAGVLDQIPNYTNYTRLTHKKLVRMLSDAYFGMSDTDGMQITLYTGRGGIREFHRAVKEGLGEQIPMNIVLEGSKFITGEGRNLALTGFFDAFYHIDGFYVKVKHNPLFDLGVQGLASAEHPDGLPLESYRMVFIDDAPQEGRPNLTYVSHKGIPEQHGCIRGLTDVPKSVKALNATSVASSQAPQISSEINEGSYHRLKSCGIQLQRANRCLHLECVAGLG